jgi:hypothetical protein
MGFNPRRPRKIRRPETFHTPPRVGFDRYSLSLGKLTPEPLSLPEIEAQSSVD